MTTLTVAGHDVTVGDEFLKLSPEDQQSMVNHIAQHLPAGKSDEPSGVVAGLQHGIAGTISGDTSTAKLAGVPTAPLDAAASAMEPSNYKSAPLIREGGHWYNPMDYQPSAIPQMAAEAAPGMAQDMAAGWTAGKLAPGGPAIKALAGAGGYAGSMLLRTFGPGAHANADARTGTPNSPVETTDLTREAAKQAMTLPINMVGGKVLLPAAGKVTGSVLSRLGKTIGTEGAVGGATDALDQAGTTAGSKNGFNIDGNQVATSAASRAIGGAVMASPKAAAEASANRKFAAYEATPETQAAAEAVAARRATYADGRDLVGPLGGTKVAAEVANNAHKDIHTELAAASKGEDLSPDNTRTLERINAGDAVSPGLVAKLATEASPDTMHLAHQAIISKNENARGNLSDTSYTGGIGGAMENLPVIRTPIKAALTTGGAATLGALGVPGVAHAVGAVAVPAAAAVAGAYGGARMIDRLTGSRSPAQAFQDRFGGTDTPARLDPAAPTPPEPATTSVPQVSSPQDTQLWGSPKTAAPGIDANAQNTDIRGMLLMAAARRKMAAAMQPEPAPPPAPPEAPSLSPVAMKMLNAKLKQGLPPIPPPAPVPPPAPPAAPEAPQINPTALAMVQKKIKQGLPPTPAPPMEPAPAQPSFNPTALAMLKQKLKLGLPPEPAAPAAPPPVAAPAPNADPAIAPPPVAPPAVPAAQAAPTTPEAPSISQLITRMKATSAAKAAQNPAATPPGGVTPPVAPPASPEVPAPAVLPTPPVSALKKLKGTGAIKETTGPTEYMDPDTGEMLTHTPKTKADLYGKDWTHEQFAKHEADAKIASGEVKPSDRGVYESGVIHDRLSRERELQLLSQHEAAPDDTPLAKLLLQELHHTRREAEARSAIKFYSSHMSPGMRAASAHLMSRHGPFSQMWSK